MYTYFLKISCFYRRFFKTEPTRGCGNVWHVFGGQVSVFVFDIAQIPNTCTQICSGVHFTPLATPHPPRLHTCLWLLEPKYLLSII